MAGTFRALARMSQARPSSAWSVPSTSVIGITKTGEVSTWATPFRGRDVGKCKALHYPRLLALFFPFYPLGLGQTKLLFLTGKVLVLGWLLHVRTMLCLLLQNVAKLKQVDFSRQLTTLL